MRIMVSSDDSSLTARIHEILLRRGYECPASQVVSLDEAIDRTVQVRPDVLVLVLPPDPEAGFAILRDIRGMTQARIIVIGAVSDPKMILQAMRDGAHHYLDQEELSSELTTSLQQLTANFTQPTERGRVISVLGPSGGSGSSTLSVNIATTLSRLHQRCALFDFKLECGDLATLLDLEPEHTLADFCKNSERMDAQMFEQCFAQHSSGVHLLAAPGTYREVQSVTPQDLRKALSMARDMFAYLVIDLDHSYRKEQIQALLQSDIVLIVLRLDFTALLHTQRALHFLKEIGIDTHRIRLIVNRYRRPKELRVSQVEDSLKMKVTYFVPDDPKTIIRANNKGIPVVLFKPRARVSRSIVEIAMSVNGAHISAENYDGSNR